MESVFDQEVEYWSNKKGVPNKLDAALKPHKGQSMKVLDLGCGAGRLASALASDFGSVYGLDSSQALVQRATTLNPGAVFAHGDFQSLASWQSLNVTFDVIVSNCAIRKDYCPNLNAVARLCSQHLNPQGVVIFRIQSVDDLEGLLPVQLRKSLFYSKEEIEKAFNMFPQVRIATERYSQKFSSPEYVLTFLRRINIRYQPTAIDSVLAARRYYILKAQK